MRFSTALFSASLAAITIAAPTPTLSKRASTCGQYDTVETGSYTIYNNLWGESDATSGKQCFDVLSLKDKALSWRTSWTWAGGANNVKSYANAVVSFTSKQLQDITAMPASFYWSYSGSNLVADVSFDMFTSSTASGSNEYEIMVWMAALGDAGPISTSYGSDGKPTPIATPTIGIHKWKLYKGPNGDTTVFSFVADEGQYNGFNGDIKKLLHYLVEYQSLPSTQYLLSVGAGTEAFTGTDAVFDVSTYKIDIET